MVNSVVNPYMIVAGVGQTSIDLVDGGNPIRILSNSEVRATKYTSSTAVGTVLTLDTDYTLATVSETTTLTLTTALASGESLVIERVSPFSTTLDLTTQQNFAAESVEQQLDRLNRQIQDLDARITRGVSTHALEATGFALPDLDTRKGKIAFFNATSGALENATVDEADISSLAGLSASIAAQLPSDLAQFVSDLAGLSIDNSWVLPLASSDPLPIAKGGTGLSTTSALKDLLHLTGLQEETGGASAPSYSWSGSTDTGMYRAAEDEIGFSAGGNEIMRIEADGIRFPSRSSIIDVHYAESSTGYTRTSTTVGDLSDNLDIIPSSDESKFLIFFVGSAQIRRTSAGADYRALLRAQYHRTSDLTWLDAQTLYWGNFGHASSSGRYYGSFTFMFDAAQAIKLNGSPIDRIRMRLRGAPEFSDNELQIYRCFMFCVEYIE